MMRSLRLLSILTLVPLGALYAADTPQKALPLPGETLRVQGHEAFVILPQVKPAAGPVPWVWYAPTLPGLPGEEEKWMFERFTRAGGAVAGIDVGESFGSPDGRALYTAFYDELTKNRGFAPKAVMLGRSRGGLMTLSWAADNPDKVAGFAGVYPVCSLVSYPGVEKACGAYHLTREELSAHLAEYNPIDRLAELARAGVPLFAIHGDSDTVVPLEANSGEMKKCYEALGGTMQLVVPPGQGHNMWTGFFQCQELVDFVLARFAANGALTLTSPLDYQVIQRRTATEGDLHIQGKTACAAEKWQYRLLGKTMTGQEDETWHDGAVPIEGGAIDFTVKAPAGGWYRLEVRGVNASGAAVEADIAHVGVGEVFIVAGQSNAGNYGSEKQVTKTGRVGSFNGARWALANDPQQGAGGAGGSFMPAFGDAMSERFHVPVGIVPIAEGGTSVRQWLPKGERVKQQPTTGGMNPVGDGEWESTGDLFDRLVQRFAALGPEGFRAILWHQGESDAGQARAGYPADRQITGGQYFGYMGILIRSSREKAGWAVPWFTAQTTYHSETDASDAEFRAAMKKLWDTGLSLEGPDTDMLRVEYRDGVHFNSRGMQRHGQIWADKVGAWIESLGPGFAGK